MEKNKEMYYEEKMEYPKTFGEKMKYWIDDIKQKKNDLMSWCEEHKEAVMVIAPVIITGTFEIAKAAIKKSAAKQEEVYRQDYVYDRSAGHYYELKHIKSAKKRNKKYLEIDRRRYNGEPLGEILKDMKMLK